MHKRGFTLIDPGLRGRRDDKMIQGFTLIELLVVIAILAVLAVVVVLTLNPAGLLQESRDSNRISDMNTLNSALNYSLGDNAAESLGSANTVYVSIPDPSATSTAGDQCQGLNLISLPATYAYHCAASSTYRQTNGNGWIPVSLQNNTFGSSLAQLPIDPVNTSSSRHYYTYETDASGHFEVTATMESAKYQLGGSGDVITSDGGTLASVYEKGSKLGLEPLDYGDSSLVGYWTFDEGVGSTTYDYSGNNATGSWNGTAIGTSGYYLPGKPGPWAGAFDGSSTYVALTPATPSETGDITFSFWINLGTVSNTPYPTIYDRNSQNPGTGFDWIFFNGSTNILHYQEANGSSYNDETLTTPGQIPFNSWTFVTITNQKSSKTVTMYLNGSIATSTTYSTIPLTVTSGNVYIGSYATSHLLQGVLDDFRIYNRALTAPQIQAMYAGGK